jgi:hypothetical protein
MNQRTDTIVSGVSYAGGATSVVAGLTLTDVGIIIGIVTALATFAFNWFYQHQKHKREEVEHEARMRQLRGEE